MDKFYGLKCKCGEVVEIEIDGIDAAKLDEFFGNKGYIVCGMCAFRNKLKR